VHYSNPQIEAYGSGILGTDGTNNRSQRLSTPL